MSLAIAITMVLAVVFVVLVIVVCAIRWLVGVADAVIYKGDRLPQKIEGEIRPEDFL